MDKAFLKNSILFRGMSEEDISAAVSFLQAQEQEYKKGDFVFHAGSQTDRMGLVLDGSVTIENNDMWGNRTILSHVSKGQFFAETYAYLPDEPMLVDVTANENCRILFLRIGNLRAPAYAAGPWLMTFVSNLLRISAHKNLTLSGRSFHTAPKTIRGRVLSYLNSVSLQKKRREFDIPFDRQQLADYLGLERSALSKELGKMQKDGLITVKKSHFVLHHHAGDVSRGRIS